MITCVSNSSKVKIEINAYTTALLWVTCKLFTAFHVITFLPENYGPTFTIILTPWSWGSMVVN